MSFVFRLIVGILLAIWLMLILLGKGGFVHIILVTALSIGMIELLCVYRRQVKM